MSDSADIQADTDPLRERIVAALMCVYDPEIPIDIYQLGLIYELDVDEEGFVDVVMTLTTPSCPVAGQMPGMVKAAVEQVDGVVAAEVQLTFEPQWTMDRMSEVARLELGFM